MRRTVHPFAPASAVNARWRGRRVPRWQQLGSAGRMRRFRSSLYRIAPGVAELMPAGTARYLIRASR
jgi:hypothetical protein